MYDHEETEIVKITRNKQGLRLCQTHFKLPLHLAKETKQDAVALMFQLCFLFVSILRNLQRRPYILNLEEDP